MLRSGHLLLKKEDEVMHIFSCCYKYLLYSYHLQLVYVHGRRLMDSEIINLFLRRRVIPITLSFRRRYD